jgi:hypothetical protein
MDKNCRTVLGAVLHESSKNPGRSYSFSLAELAPFFDLCYGKIWYTNGGERKETCDDCVCDDRHQQHGAGDEVL